MVRKVTDAVARKPAKPPVQKSGGVEGRSDAGAAEVAAKGTSTLGKREHPPLTLAERAPITGLRFFGLGRPAFNLPTSQHVFTAGTGLCDCAIPKEDFPKVSSFHATLTRAGSDLVLKDQDSKNGSFPSKDEPRKKTFPVRAGVPFWLANLPLLAMDTHLDVLRHRVAACLGLDAHSAIDKVIEIISLGAPLVLIGPRGTDALALADAIHLASTRRDNFFLRVTSKPIPSFDHAYGGTVFMDLGALKKLPEPMLKPLFQDGHGMRAIFAAPDERIARSRLDTYRDEVKGVTLVPLQERPADILPLIGHHWIDELRTTRRLDELGARVDGLTAYTWPGNLDELREASTRLHAYLVHGSLVAAAAQIGITHQALSKYFKRIGFQVQSEDDL